MYIVLAPPPLFRFFTSSRGFIFVHLSTFSWAPLLETGIYLLLLTSGGSFFNHSTHFCHYLENF